MIGFICIKDFFTEYTTTRLVRIRSPFIATVNTVLVILVWCSYLGSLQLDVRKVYQSSCNVHGVVLSKLKGYASTEHLTDEDLSVENPNLYRRVWDPADIVYPVQGGEGETGSFTIVTNLIITPNQTLGFCGEELGSFSKCTNDSQCQEGFSSPATHGIYTGKCENLTGSCQIHGWCPIEPRRLPRKGLLPLMEDVENFTVMLKNTVEFPGCNIGSQQGRNLPHESSKADYLKNCMYDKETDPLCPIFRIGDIIRWAGGNFTKMGVIGGVFRIKIGWRCDFDFGRTVENCLPTYDFVRVDDREASVSKGWNFRSAKLFRGNHRLLRKQFGLKILINLEGEGRKFDFFQLVITLGATIGLFSVAPLVCDFLMDVFNAMSNLPHCAIFYTFHDNTMTRYGDEEAKVNGEAKTNEESNGEVSTAKV